MAPVSVSASEIESLSTKLRTCIVDIDNALRNQVMGIDQVAIVSYRQLLAHEQTLNDREQRDYADQIGAMVATAATGAFKRGWRQPILQDYVVSYLSAVHCFIAIKQSEAEQIHNLARSHNAWLMAGGR